MRAAAILLAALSVGAIHLRAVGFGGQAQSGTAPRNDLPQPYQTTRDWGELPAGVKWAAVTAIEAAPDGSIYVIHRCFANSCANRPEAPILKYNAAGKLLASWGAKMFIFPHGATVDRDGNLWVTDARGENGIGHQVFKFSPDGKVLMTLGQAGVSGSTPDLFDQPTDVLVAPSGDIFVTDSHRNGKNNRVVRFTKDGKYIKEWGKTGYAPSEFRAIHAIAMDSRGRIFVGDRANNRIQLFDQEGKFLTQWTQFGRPSGIAFDANDRIFVADSESDDVENPGWEMGIRIGEAKTGWVTEFILFPWGDPRNTAGNGAEFVAVDRDGNIYGGEPSPKQLRKYIRVRP